MKNATVALTCALLAGTAGYYGREFAADTEPLITSVPRSGSWGTVRAKHLKSHPNCEVCGRQTEIEVHHMVPFSEAPELELVPSNLITLCRTCHFGFGHLWRWDNSNKTVKRDAEDWSNKRKGKHK